jgi:hypothetical protein
MVAAFRNILASMGTEMNLEEAERAYDASKNVVERSRRMSMMDLWEIEGMEEVPLKDREEALELYRGAKEL